MKNYANQGGVRGLDKNKTKKTSIQGCAIAEHGNPWSGSQVENLSFFFFFFFMHTLAYFLHVQSTGIPPISLEHSLQPQSAY